MAPPEEGPGCVSSECVDGRGPAGLSGSVLGALPWAFSCLGKGWLLRTIVIKLPQLFEIRLSGVLLERPTLDSIDMGLGSLSTTGSWAATKAEARAGGDVEGGVAVEIGVKAGTGVGDGVGGEVSDGVGVEIVARAVTGAGQGGNVRDGVAVEVGVGAAIPGAGVKGEAGVEVGGDTEGAEIEAPAVVNVGVRKEAGPALRLSPPEGPWLTSRGKLFKGAEGETASRNPGLGCGAVAEDGASSVSQVGAGAGRLWEGVQLETCVDFLVSMISARLWSVAGLPAMCVLFSP